MTILDWLHGSMIRLGEAGVDSPRRDSLVLLEDILQKDREWVLANPQHDLHGQTLIKLERLLKRRIKREPLAYIRGKAWFYKRFFKVTPDVMIPRPESESFIELIKEIKPKKVIDIGTGSGCLAITTKLELPDTDVLAIDNSQKAMDLARTNAASHKVDVDFHKGSLLSPLMSSSRLTNYNLQTTILANLPYVPEALVTSPEIKCEPPEALFSGADGLDHYKKFWQQIASMPKLPENILTESLADQHSDLQELAVKSGYELRRTEGLVQHYKIVDRS